MLAGQFFTFDESVRSSFVPSLPLFASAAVSGPGGGSGDHLRGTVQFPPGATALDHRHSLYWDHHASSSPFAAVGGPHLHHVHKSGMSLPSPNGSTSSVLSSEDSSSAASTPRSLGAPPALLHHHHLQQQQQKHHHQAPGGPSSGQQQNHHHHHPPHHHQLLSGSPGQRSSIKICGVCGDRAKSYHFGGISCDSCKAFFRRSVQNDAYKNFHCPYESQCDISISSRKCCQYCRFKKCLSIGMERSWVMTEEERLQKMKSQLEKKQRQKSDENTPLGSCGPSGSKRRLLRLRASYEPDANSIGNYLSQSDVNTIESLINEYLASCREVPFKEEPIITGTAAAAGPLGNGTKSRTQLLDMFFTAIQQLALFAQRVRSFTAVEPGDQQILLRGAVLEMAFIWSAHLFDSDSLCWPDRRKLRPTTTTRSTLSPPSTGSRGAAGESPSPNGNSLSSVSSSSVSLSSSSSPLQSPPPPMLSAADLAPLISQELFEKHMNFIKSIKDLDVDEASLSLLSVIVLLSPDRMGLSDSALVSQEQERYLIILKNYINWRFGESASTLIYPKLLLKLPDLREIAEALTDFELNLCREEIESVHARLGNLKLDSDDGQGLLPPRQPQLVALSAIGHQPPPTQPWTLRRDALPAPSARTRSYFCPETDELSTSSECSEKYLHSD